MTDLTEREVDILLAHVEPIRGLWLDTARGLTLRGYHDRASHALSQTVFFDGLIAKLRSLAAPYTRE